jgi:hypothetical protein
MLNDAQLTARMADLVGAWERDGDRRSIFLACYARMTAGMLAALAAGRFHDRAWVRELIHNFAGYYFVALDAYEGGSPALPGSWRAAFDGAREPATPVVASLLLGVNAHINHDLVLVVADMLTPAWGDLGPAGRRARYEDYATVNAVIGETVDRVQDEVVQPYARLMQLADLACGPLDEWCTARLIARWRADVWAQALAIVEAPDLPTGLALRRRADATALARGRLLIDGGDLGARAFGYPLRWLGRLRLI